MPSRATAATLPFGHRLIAASFAAVLAAFTGSFAHAGSCPADKVTTDGQKAGPTKPIGVTDTVLTKTDLGAEKVGLKGYDFRLRRLVIKSGGVVPWHSHGERPAMIYIIKGTISEAASTCAVPIVHKAGDVAPERHTTSHWWKNHGKQTVVLISVDINRDPNDKHM